VSSGVLEAEVERENDRVSFRFEAGVDAAQDVAPRDVRTATNNSLRMHFSFPEKMNVGIQRAG
jgi:hypothetical protein